MEDFAQLKPASPADNLSAKLLHECWPGGPIVRDPGECRDMKNSSDTSSFLPAIEIAGRTYRNDGKGGTTDERDGILDRRFV